MGMTIPANFWTTPITTAFRETQEMAQYVDYAENYDSDHDTQVDVFGDYGTSVYDGSRKIIAVAQRPQRLEDTKL